MPDEYHTLNTVTIKLKNIVSAPMTQSATKTAD